jgi:hypothetical protein
MLLIAREAVMMLSTPLLFRRWKVNGKRHEPAER